MGTRRLGLAEVNRPGQMTALVATSQGAEAREIARPLAGPGQVVVGVDCAGLCRTDLYAADGQLSVPEGLVLGHEFCGTVRSVGEGVEKRLLGRRVAVFPWLGCGHCATCRRSQEGQALCSKRRLLGVDLDGAFCSEIAIPADRLSTIPDAMENRAAAYAEPVAGALGAEKAVPRSALVGIFGDNRIGSLTARLLAHLGRRPVSGEQAEEESLEIALEASADPPTLTKAMLALRPGGTLVVKSRPPGPVAWPLRLQVEKELKVLSAGYGDFARAIALLSEQPHLFSDLWEDPLPLRHWPEVFARERAGLESRKAFFLPDPLE